MFPAMPAYFAPVWLGVFILIGWVGWKKQAEGWFLVAFAWLLVVGPACWMGLGAAVT